MLSWLQEWALYHTGGFGGYRDQMRILTLAMSAIAELSVEGLRPGPMDHKCVMMATAANRLGGGASECCDGNRSRPRTIKVQ